MFVKKIVASDQIPASSFDIGCCSRLGLGMAIPLDRNPDRPTSLVECDKNLNADRVA